ncbi:MAG: hypothetical protein JW940_04335 [Polyangiaceae bacterium]|nr:hypothetical protein [Polyangiaceae bacterium]
MTRARPDSNPDADTSGRTSDSDWQLAHAELERLAHTRARLDSKEGYWLLRALRARVHVELGYGSFAEYVERMFGYEPRWTHEKLRVAQALEQMPELRRALSGGELSWSAVRELTRVATAETQAAWIEAAQGKTLRELERQVSGRRPGDRPGDHARASALRHVLRFEVCADTLAVVREAMAKLRRDSGSSLDDDAALLLMARHVLGGPTDAGRSSYQMLLSVCERCGRAALEARGQLVEVGPEVVEMASCDAQSIRAVGPDVVEMPSCDAQSIRAVGPDVVRMPSGDAQRIRAVDADVVQMPSGDAQSIRAVGPDVVQMPSGDAQSIRAVDPDVVQMPSGDAQRIRAVGPDVVRMPSGDAQRIRAVGPDVVQMPSCDAQSIRAADVKRDAQLDAKRHSVPHVSHEGDHPLGRESATHVGEQSEHPLEHTSLTHPGRKSATGIGRDTVAQASDAPSTHVGHACPVRSCRARDTRVESEPERYSRKGVATGPRATQAVPPAVRRWVMRRDRGCCVVPGCKNAIFVDVHHIRPRSEGGDHEPDGLAVLCAAHHRAAHRGQLLIEGHVSTGLVFRHADGRRYGEAVCAARAGAWADVFRALRSLGFAETETRRALEKTRSEVSELGERPGVEPLLRRALGVLMEARGQRRPMPKPSAKSGLGARAPSRTDAREPGPPSRRPCRLNRHLWPHSSLVGDLRAARLR